jgi:hypothetical protein
MDESRRQAIRSELDEIHLAGKLDSRPLLFRLGNGLVSLGRGLRQRSNPRRRDYWAAQHNLRAEQR